MSYDFESANNSALFFGLGDWYFMTDEEKTRIHEQKQNMPSYGQEAVEARRRNLERARLRKLKTSSRLTSGPTTSD